MTTYAAVQVVFLGMTVASPLMGLLADHYGRRTVNGARVLLQLAPSRQPGTSPSFTINQVISQLITGHG